MTIYGPGDLGGAQGLSHGLLLADLPADDLRARLATERFSGFVGPRTGRWTVAVAQTPLGHVASRRRGLIDLARDLSTDAPTVGVAVVRDELMVLWAGDGGTAAIEYVSDPSIARPDDDEAGDAPEGAHQAPALVALAAVPVAAGTVESLLAEPLGESENESERLQTLCRLLGWPQWLVAVDSLPRRVPGGPDAAQFTRLSAGRTGMGGWAAARVSRVVRRKA